MEGTNLTLEQLQAIVAKNEAVIIDLQKKADGLAKTLVDKETDFANTIKQKDHDAKAQAKELAEVKKVNIMLAKKVEDLSKKHPAGDVKKEAPAEPKLTDLEFTADGVKYGFNWPVQTVKRVRIHAADVVADTALQAKLVAENSPWLRKKP